MPYTHTHTQIQTARLLADKYAHSLKFKMFIFLSRSFHFTFAYTADFIHDACILEEDKEKVKKFP